MILLTSSSTPKLVSFFWPFISVEADILGYSAHNTPHLAPAVELENALVELSAKLPSLGVPTTLNSSSDLDQIVPLIESAIDSIKIWQFYVFDTQASVRDVATALESGKAQQWPGEPVQGKSVDELAQIAKSTAGLIHNYRAWSGRFCTKADPAVAAGFVQAAYPGDDSTNLASKWGKVVDVINVDLYAECNDDVKAAKSQVIDRLKYTRLDAGGPRMGEISEK
jgi:glycogen debranching enzyme